jgi:peptidoglycan/xylan/chitin deacetylase (PgdA/CDA1 family)
MKKHLALAILTVILCHTPAHGQLPASGAVPHARIARYSGDRAAAISYTFDDNTRDQYTVGVPMLNEVGFKGTFFVIPGATVETVEEAAKKMHLKRAWGSITWTELKEMSGQGHEIASHTWSHPNLTKLAPGEVDAQFSKACEAIRARIGKPPLTLAFPFNTSTPGLRAAALKYHVACRAYQTGLGEKSTVESLNAWADKQVRDRTWGVIMAHAIANGYAALDDPEILRTHLRHVKSREREIWVDTFANIARYEMERDHAKLVVTGSVGNLTCLLSGNPGPDKHDVPLTFVIDAAGATSVRAEREGRELPAHATRDAIHVEAVPDSQPITVTWK